MLVYVVPNLVTAFTLVTTLSAALFMFVWSLILLAYIAYRRKRPQQHAASVFKMPGGVAMCLGGAGVLRLRDRAADAAARHPAGAAGQPGVVPDPGLPGQAARIAVAARGHHLPPIREMRSGGHCPVRLPGSVGKAAGTPSGGANAGHVRRCWVLQGRLTSAATAAIKKKPGRLEWGFGLNYLQLTSKICFNRTCSAARKSGAINITYIGPSLSPRS